MNKKEIGILIGILVLLLVLMVFVAKPNKEEKETSSTTEVDTIIENAQKESAEVKEEEKKDFISINVDQYLGIYEEEDLKLVLVGRPTCHYCQLAEPILKNITYTYGFDIYYLNTDEFSDDDKNNFLHSNEIFEEGFGTPLLLLVSNSTIVDKVDGLMDKDHYLEFFKAHGFIE